ncbi:hypothetical protein EYF80_009474 [Liparis tanakae]|uniref:Uncharacterized protein n=1 Tax=Liparis tanakae TaxID=230148 RepID=A0A4Z2IQA9_9TELE|nr:hypothetical protein EYF80_009474 [Liparis tanakae]
MEQCAPVYILIKHFLTLLGWKLVRQTAVNNPSCAKSCFPKVEVTIRRLRANCLLLHGERVDATWLLVSDVGLSASLAPDVTGCVAPRHTWQMLTKARRRSLLLMA